MKIKTLAHLRALGWSKTALNQLVSPLLLGKREAEKRALLEEAALFGSPLFIQLWKLENQDASLKKAKGLLRLAMESLAMPFELEGTVSEARRLLDKMADLPPHHAFWADFSRTVRRAFPGESLLDQERDASLKRQIHQFRYVISCQQAQWVRSHYGQGGIQDQAALAAYLSELEGPSIWIGSSARLHNKAYVGEEGTIWPDGATFSANYKVLIDFHTEFILSADGSFLNELDAEKMSQAGIVNGASFNYGLRDQASNDQAHSRYDIAPTRLYEPAYRERVLANQGCPFRAPSYDRSPKGYLAKRGFYAHQGRSLKWQVDRAAWNLERQVRKKKPSHFFKQVASILGLSIY